MAGTTKTSPRPPGAGHDGGHDLGWALGAVLRSWSRETTGAVADLPGGPRGYQVLSMATGGRCGTQAAMAERLGLDRTVMTHLIDDLEDAGYVRRRPDPADRRARLVELTDKGRTAHAEVAEQLSGIEDTVLSGLDPESTQQFRDLLYRAASAIVDPPQDSCEVAHEFPEHT